LQYLRQQSRLAPGPEELDKSAWQEIIGGSFFGGSIGLISGLIIALIIALLRLLLGNPWLNLAENYFPGLVVAGLYLGLLAGLGSGLLNVFSNRTFSSAALKRLFAGFGGWTTRLLQPNPAKPLGSLGQATLSGLAGLFYGLVYGLVIGLIGAGLLAGFTLPGAGAFPSAPEFLVMALVSVIIGAVVGGVIGGVGGVFYGLLAHPQS
jgi:hypothetical protein